MRALDKQKQIQILVQAILVEEDKVTLEGLGACLQTEGKLGQNIVREYDAGTTISVRRGLQDVKRILPKTAVSFSESSLSAPFMV